MDAVSQMDGVRDAVFDWLMREAVDMLRTLDLSTRATSTVCQGAPAHWPGDEEGEEVEEEEGGGGLEPVDPQDMLLFHTLVSFLQVSPYLTPL
jgi:hypothetical protein